MVAEERSLNHVSSAKLFQKSWEVYRKLVDNNDLCHHNLIEVISSNILATKKGARVSVLDLGCGDAHIPSVLFKNLKGSVDFASFTGVDASRQALNIAKENLNMPKVQMIEEELEEYLEGFSTTGCGNQFDIILANLVIHHFSSEVKKILVSKIYALVAPGGTFYYGDVYNTEPDSDRESMMSRWRVRFDTFKGLTPEELADVWNHVYSKDFPESIDFMRECMAEAGFENVEVLFKDDFYTCCLSGKKPL